jgi:acetylglutamate kinase
MTGERGYSPELRTAALLEALPYIQRFRGAIVVVKLGGNALAADSPTADSPADSDAADADDDAADLLATFAEDIVMLRSVGLHPVVVHGGGPQIGDLLSRLGKESTFVNGLRVTDAETLDVARMVLVGKVGRNIVGRINRHGAYAVGMSGEDGGLIRATVRDPELGLVGDVAAVNPGIV